MKTSRFIDKILDAEIDPAFSERARFIINFIEKKKPKRILDAGCGRGFYLQLLSLLKFPQKIVGIDISKKYILEAKKNISGNKNICVLKCSLYKLPYKDNYFDAVICSEVLEHIKNDKLAIKEICRVLKKNGLLIITVPNINFPFLWDPVNWILMKVFKTHINKNVWWLAGIWADHERLYSEKDIRRILETNFSILEIKHFTRLCWPFSHFLLYGIGKNIVERFSIEHFNRFAIYKGIKIKRFISLFMKFPSLFYGSFKTSSSVCIGCAAVKK